MARDILRLVAAWREQNVLKITQSPTRLGNSSKKLF
jgi:hypothetical protein